MGDRSASRSGSSRWRRRSRRSGSPAPEWIFERKFDGIRLIAFKQGRDVRLFSRNRLLQNASYPAVVAAIAAPAGARRHPRRRGDRRLGTRGDASPTTSSTSSGSTGALSRRCRSTSGGAFLTSCRSDRRLSACALLDGHRAVGPRVPRGLGRRHRQAARLAVRASPLAALAEDEMRGVAGARRRRLHRSAAQTRRSRRAARRLLRRRRLRVRRQGRHRLRHEAAARPARAARAHRDRRRRRSRKPWACRASARTGCGRRSSCRSRSSSGPCTASCAIRGCSASAPTRRRATSCGSRQ